MISHPFFQKQYHNFSLAKTSILITGGAGFIGSNLAEYFLLNGAAKVRVLDNLSNGFKRNIEPFLSNPAYEFLEGDITDLETCKKACEGIELISHQAALGSVPRSRITSRQHHVDESVRVSGTGSNGIDNGTWYRT